jgi:uncharacterized protein YhbP (UPF0306 family)
VTRSGSAIDNAALRDEIRAFLLAHHVVSLATIVDGAAHAASVMFAAEDLSLYWTSDPGSRHSLAIERNSRVAATVAPDYADFRFIRGVQIAGRACRLGEAAEAAHARELLRRRFPFLRELDGMPAALRAALDKGAYYRLDPDTITLIDNTRGFGNRHTLRIP